MSKKNVNVPELATSDGTMAGSPQEKACALADYFDTVWDSSATVVNDPAPLTNAASCHQHEHLTDVQPIIEELKCLNGKISRR